MFEGGVDSDDEDRFFDERMRGGVENGSVCSTCIVLFVCVMS